MKKLILLLALFGVLGVSCSKDDDNVNNSQKPNDKPKGAFVTDVEGVYTVDMSGGEVVVTVTSDIEYKVVIPTDAKSWISIADTRADLRIDKIKFIIAPNETFEELKADVNLVANNGYVLQKISFVQQGNTKVFNSDCEESYSIGAVGGKINIKISTNLDYDVVIPNNDKLWISVADTRAVVREETLTLIVAENKITEERSSVVTLYDKDDNILQKINITQSAKSNTIANNEIWYTTTDGKKLFPPTTEPAVFGAFLVSNTYSDGKGVLTFDDDITLIGDSAFSDCTTLATITIPESVTTIGNSAFDGCSSLTSITIPESVTTIGEDAFDDCSSLTSVTIPDSVTSIGKYAFYGCTGELTVNCNIPSASNYEYGAFYGSKFTSVTIGDSVTSIGNYTFYNCSSLTSVYITDLPAWYKIDFGNTAANPLSNGANLYLNNELLTDLVIPSDITEIKPYVFAGCGSLIGVTIPDSVTSIGKYAFYGCTGELVVNCNIPSASSSSGGAFYGSKFTTVTIGDSVTTIGNYAFEDCRSLTSITIPDSVTTIGDYAFRYCSSLTSVTIPDSVTSIGNYAFSGCSSLTSITIPDSVTTIGVSAFSGCTGELIVNCNIPDAYFDYDYYDYRSVFYGSKFTTVTIGDSVTIIGSYAFSGCSSLTSITIPDSVTTIGERAFRDCSSLREFNGKYASGDGRCLIIDGTLNSFAPAGLTEYTIPDSVTTIGYYAFAYCSSLTSVTIPDSVTTIGDYAFGWSKSLTSVTIPDSVTTIGDGAFSGCSSLTSVTIPDSVTTIGESAFYYCSRLREFNGKYASGDGRCLIIDGTLNSFAPAGLTEYVIPDGVTSIGRSAFSGCSSLTSVTIPKSVTMIGVNAFYGCSSLTSVTIPKSVTMIGNSAFTSCYRLISVTIPDSVTSIGNLAFAYCDSLTSVTIGDSVTTIGDYAFGLCESLRSVYCEAVTPPAGGSEMFYGNASYRDIYVPTESVNAYKSANYWKDYANAIVGYDF